jgi:hypothetical protein
MMRVVLRLGTPVPRPPRAARQPAPRPVRRQRAAQLRDRIRRIHHRILPRSRRPNPAVRGRAAASGVVRAERGTPVSSNTSVPLSVIKKNPQVNASGSSTPSGAPLPDGLQRPRAENPRITQARRGHVHNRFGERFADILVQRRVAGMWVDVDLPTGRAVSLLQHGQHGGIIRRGELLHGSCCAPERLLLGIRLEAFRHDPQAHRDVVIIGQDVKVFNIGRTGNPSSGRMLVAIMDHDLPAWIRLIRHRLTSDHSRPLNEPLPQRISEALSSLEDAERRRSEVGGKPHDRTNRPTERS